MKINARQNHRFTPGPRLYLPLSQRLLIGSALLVAVFDTAALHAQANSDPLFIDKQGQVGIGTTAPAAKLDVNGSAVFRAKTVIVTSNGAAALTLGSIDGARLALQYKLDESKHRIGFADGNGAWSLWSQNGDGSAYIAGNLGVGKQAAAASKLDVNGSANVSGNETVGGNESVTGNIGVGVVTPGFPLSFPDKLGDKISLWGQSGNSYGFGIQGGQLQIHTDAAGADVVFGYGKSASIVETMRIKGNKDVLIAGRLFVTGMLSYYWQPDGKWKQIQNRGGNYAGSYDAPAPSDLRLKKNLQPILSPLDKVRSLRGVTYRWNNDALRYLTRDIETSVSAGPEATEEQNQKAWQNERDERYKELAKIQVGVVAQDVEAVLPEAVTTDSIGYKLVKYSNLIPLLVEALKEEDTRTQSQAQTIMRQQAEIQDLSAANESVRQQLVELAEMKRRLASVEASMSSFMAPANFEGRKAVVVASQSPTDKVSPGGR